MSAIPSSLFPTTSIASTSTSSSTTGNSSTTNPLSSMSPMDFVNLLVTQLQNQDPLNPTSTSDILTQVSQIGQLQSATQLSSVLAGLSQNNQIAAGSALIGKQVTGIDPSNNSTTGVVTSVAVSQNNVTLSLDNGDTLSLSNVTSIANAPVASTATTAAATAAAALPTVNVPTTGT
jgi:flagellar basal-body rod modification protein FlgD